MWLVWQGFMNDKDSPKWAPKGQHGFLLGLKARGEP
jgi:hypothetical protein